MKKHVHRPIYRSQTKYFDSAKLKRVQTALPMVKFTLYELAGALKIAFFIHDSYNNFSDFLVLFCLVEFVNF